MLDANKLRGKLVENGITIEAMANALKINPSTFYRKIKKNSFEIGEADMIVKILNLSSTEASAIFFSQYVA